MSISTSSMVIYMRLLLKEKVRLGSGSLSMHERYSSERRAMLGVVMSQEELDTTVIVATMEMKRPIPIWWKKMWQSERMVAFISAGKRSNGHGEYIPIES
jgi:hypothetical protein